jgi:hypothetical protein
MIDGRTNTVTFFTVAINKKKSLILMISGQAPLLILPLSVIKEGIYEIDASTNTSLIYYHNDEEKSLILMM